MALIEIHVHSDDAKLEKILNLLTDIGEKMVTQADIDVLTQQAQKIQAEVAAAADALRAQIQALQDQIDQGLALDLTGLQAALQMLDDLNPDAPPPVEE